MHVPRADVRMEDHGSMEMATQPQVPIVNWNHRRSLSCARVFVFFKKNVLHPMAWSVDRVSQ